MPVHTFAAAKERLTRSIDQMHLHLPGEIVEAQDRIGAPVAAGACRRPTNGARTGTPPAPWSSFSGLPRGRQQRQRSDDLLRSPGLGDDRGAPRTVVTSSWRVRGLQHKAHILLLQCTRYDPVVLGAGAPVDDCTRKVGLPNARECMRGSAHNDDSRTRLLERSLEIERNERLSLNHEEFTADELRTPAAINATRCMGVLA